MKMIKITFCVILMFFLAACGKSVETNTQVNSQSGEEKYVLKLAHGFTTANFMHTFMEWYNEEIQKRSNGRLSIEIFPSGQLMPVDQEMPAILQGQIDMSHATSPVMASFDPIWNFYEMPFIFDFDPKDPGVFLENRMKFNQSETGGQKIAKKMEERGLKVLAFGFVDMFGSVYTTDADNLVTGPDSAKGLKLRTPGGMIGPETAKAIGASSVTIAGAEVVTALQQGTVDGLLTTPIYANDAQLPVESFSMVPMLNSVTPLIISKSKFDSLPEDLQQILVETGKDLEEHAFQMVLEKAKTAYETLENKGVKIYYPTDEEKAEWEKATQPAREAFVNQVEGGQELLDALKNVK